MAITASRTGRARGRGMWSRTALLLALLGGAVAGGVRHAAADPPAGQSALLNGMHDMEAAQWMGSATPGCDKGWIVDLQYIGDSGQAAANCHDSAIQAGISVIQRLDLSGGASVPTAAEQVAGYAGAFASFALKCPKIHVWIVGNEPNFSTGQHDPDCTASLYGDTYVEVRRRVHALAGHEDDLVLATPNSPYSPGCLESLRAIIRRIKMKGVDPDGFAIHAYTRAPTGGEVNPGWVTSTATQNDGTNKQCPGSASWNDTWHSHFRIYKDYVKVIEAEGLGGKPVYITESGNACDVWAGNACYPDADVGYFTALYAEADAYNRSDSSTKIRAIAPYRFTRNDDGTGRDFAIGERSRLLTDLKRAFAKGYAWTQPASCSFGWDGGTDGGGDGAAGDGGAVEGGVLPTDAGAGDLGGEPRPRTAQGGCACEAAPGAVDLVPLAGAWACALLGVWVVGRRRRHDGGRRRR